MKILIADKDAKSRESLSRWLRQLGHEVFLLRDETELMREIRQRNPQFVFLDIDFPVKGIRDCIQEMTGLDPSMAVVMVGTDEGCDRMEEAMLAGSSGFILKQASPEAILEKVKSVLENKSTPVPKAKIMVVDDDPNVCRLLGEFLKRKGYEVIQAANGEEALDKLGRDHPRLVLLDYSMPGMNGLEILARMMKIDPKLGVIMVTALSEEWIWRRARDLGAYDYLVKPVDLKYLDLVIATKLILMEGA